MCPQTPNQTLINLIPKCNYNHKSFTNQKNQYNENKSNYQNYLLTKFRKEKINSINSKKYEQEDNLNYMKYQNLNNNRKYSRDSEESTSNEDKEENLQINNNSKKIPFKSNAYDFKVKYKTELCKYYEINGKCKYGDNCAYAHGKENLRSKVTHSTYYRTKKCVQFFTYGFCPYGNRCQFAHGLKTNILNNPYDRNMSYCKTLETLSKLENVENIKTLFEKKRLPIFKEICPNYEGIKSELFDDIKSLINDNSQM